MTSKKSNKRTKKHTPEKSNKEVPGRRPTTHRPANPTGNQVLPYTQNREKRCPSLHKQVFACRLGEKSPDIAPKSTINIPRLFSIERAKPPGLSVTKCLGLPAKTSRRYNESAKAKHTPEKCDRSFLPYQRPTDPANPTGNQVLPYTQNARETMPESRQASACLSLGRKNRPTLRGKVTTPRFLRAEKQKSGQPPTIRIARPMEHASGVASHRRGGE